MAANVDTEWLTLPEAAKALRVSTITLHRWVKQGRLPAYRLGPRKVRVRREDLSSVFSPAQREEVIPPGRTTPEAAAFTVRPLSKDEVQRGRKALEAARILGERILARTGGKSLDSSVPVIQAAREERDRQLHDR